jgi:hypothetical protein
MSAQTPVSDDYVVYDGRTLQVAFGVDEGAAVLDDGGPFPDAIRRGDSGRGPWVHIPADAVQRSFRRTAKAVWDGGEIPLLAVAGDEVAFQTRDPRWAEQHGLEGSQYDGGWRGRAPVAELRNITVTDTDRPLP